MDEVKAEKDAEKSLAKIRPGFSEPNADENDAEKRTARSVEIIPHDF